MQHLVVGRKTVFHLRVVLSLQQKLFFMEKTQDLVFGEQTVNHCQDSAHDRLNGIALPDLVVEQQFSCGLHDQADVQHVQRHGDEVARNLVLDR